MDRIMDVVRCFWGRTYSCFIKVDPRIKEYDNE